LPQFRCDPQRLVDNPAYGDRLRIRGWQILRGHPRRKSHRFQPAGIAEFVGVRDEWFAAETGCGTFSVENSTGGLPSYRGRESPRIGTCTHHHGLTEAALARSHVLLHKTETTRRLLVKPMQISLRPSGKAMQCHGAL
jgi:hypothetical protein